MKKGQSLLLTVGITLIAFIIIVFIVLNTVSRFSSGSIRTNEEAIPALVSRVSEVPLEDTLSKTYSLRMNKNELFLFFSKGNGPLDLYYFGNDPVYTSFRFTRPEECVGNTCICHCTSELALSTNTEPYVDYATLKPISSDNDEGFTCPTMTCEVLDEDLQFANSRGYDQEYYSQYGNPGQGFSDASLELPLLVQYGESQTFNGELYYVTEFEEAFVKDFRNLGGVVLGGYVVGGTERAYRTGNFANSQVRIRTERFKDSNLVGICIYEQCLFEKALDDFNERIEREKLLTSLHFWFSDLQERFEVSVPNCLSQATTKQQESSCFYEQIQLIGLGNVLDEQYRSEEVIPKVKFVRDEETDTAIVQLLLSVKTSERDTTFDEDITQVTNWLGSFFGSEPTPIQTETWEGYVVSEFKIPFAFPQTTVNDVVTYFPEDFEILDFNEQDQLLIGENYYDISSVELESGVTMQFNKVLE